MLMKRLDTLRVRGSLLTNAWDHDLPFGENTWTKQKRNTCIFRVSQLKQAGLKSEQKKKWDRLQVLPLSLDKNIREYLSERYALITAKRFYFFRYIVFSGMVCGGYFETVIDGHSPYLQHFTYLIVVLYTIPAIACFLHFVATEDSPKARSSLDTKCNASQRMEGMTEDHEGIFVESMRRNHFRVFLTKWEKRGRRTRDRKNRDNERNKTPAAELLS